MGASGVAYVRNALLSGQSPILGRCVVEQVDLASGVVTSVRPAVSGADADGQERQESLFDLLDLNEEDDQPPGWPDSMTQAAAARIQDWLRDSAETACVVEQVDFAPGDRAFIVQGSDPPSDYTYHVLPPGEHSLSVIAAFLAQAASGGSFYGVVSEWPGIASMVGRECDVEMEDLETVASSARLIFLRPARENRWVFWERVDEVRRPQA